MMFMWLYAIGFSIAMLYLNFSGVPVKSLLTFAIIGISFPAGY